MSSFELLSSRFTFVYKVLSPLAVFVWFCLAMYGHITNKETPEGSFVANATWLIPFIPLFEFLACFGLIAGSLASFGDLKRVRLRNGTLYVSNYLRQIEVPLSCVVNVTEDRWTNIHPVTIHFRHVTPFGKQVVFAPSARLGPFRRSHPVVAYLKRLAGLS